MTSMMKGNRNTQCQLWLGTWSMGGLGFGPYDERHAHETLAAFFESGATHLDSAAFYAKGHSDEILAKYLKNKARDSYFLSTKGGLYWQGNRVYHDGSEQALRKSLEQALIQFNCDYIDLFQLHWPDKQLDIRVSIDALRRFKAEHKIKHWGICNPRLSDTAYFDCDDTCYSQIHFNPIHKSEQAVAELNHASGFNTVITSPFEQGLLVNPSYINSPLGNKDIRQRNPYFSTEYHAWLKAFYAAIPQTQTASRYVLKWIKSHDFCDAIILGCRTAAQLKACIQV